MPKTCKCGSIFLLSDHLNFQEKSGGGWHLANCFDGLHELLASKGLAQPNFKARHMGNTCVFYIYSF